MADIPTKRSDQTAERISHWINRKPAATLWHAFNFAAEIGRPLTLFVTLNFSLTDCPPETATRKFRLIVETFTRWWRRPSRLQRLDPQGASVYVWAAESGGGQAAIHWVVHVPPGRRADFEKRLRQWMNTTAGTAQPGAIDVRDVFNAPGLRRYLLKGCDPAYAEFCKINFEDQGVVHGKRSGVSRSLQRAARARAGYRINRTYKSRMVHPQAIGNTGAAL